MVWREPNKNLKFTQKRYKCQRELHVGFAQMFKKVDEIYPEKSSPLCSAPEESTTEGYKELRRKTGSVQGCKPER